MKRIALLILGITAGVVLRAQEPADTARFLTGLEGIVSALQDTTARIETPDTPDTVLSVPLFSDDDIPVVVPQAPREAVRDFGGITWYTYDFDGIEVAAGLRYAHEYGRYYLTDLHILNTTRTPLNFDFDAVRMSAGDGQPIRIYTHDEYLNRVRRRQNWAHFGAQMALLPLHFIALALIDDAYDDDFSLGAALLEGLSYSLVDAATDIGSALIAAHYGAEANRICQKNLGYLHDCMILPDSSVSGHFFARFDPHAREVFLDLPLNGQTYRISFLALGLPEVRSDD